MIMFKDKTCLYLCDIQSSLFTEFTTFLEKSFWRRKLLVNYFKKLLLDKLNTNSVIGKIQYCNTNIIFFWKLPDIFINISD